MRSIQLDVEKQVMRFERCFFHPFFPVYRRSVDVLVDDLGMPFTARSAGPDSPEHRLLPTKKGYVYFRMDREADRAALREVVMAHDLLRDRMGVEKADAMISRNSRLPVPMKVVLFIALGGIVYGLWYYYIYVLPKI